MNYNAISQLIDNGFDSEQVLALLVKNAPNIGKKIKSLLTGGWGTNEILSYINKDPETSRINLKNAKPATPEEIASLQIYKSKRGYDKSRDESALEDLTKFTNGALKIGASVAAPYLGGKALQTGMGALSSLINQNPIPTNPPSVNDPVEPGPNIGQQIGQQAANPVAQAMQTGTNPAAISPSVPVQTQPNIPEIPQMDFGQILDQLGVRNKVDALRESNPPEVISKIIRYGLPKDQVKQIDSQIPLDQVIQGYLQSAPPVETMREKISKGVPFGQEDKLGFKTAFGSLKNGGTTDKLYEGIYQSLKEGKDTFAGIKDPLIQKSKPFYDKGLIKNAEDIRKLKETGFKEPSETKTVLLPDGQIGEVESVKQGIAKVKVGDKIRNKKLSELMESPKEAAQAALELIKSFTPEHHRSAHHALNMYDPDTKSAQFLFHNGEGYIVEDISPDEYERLSNELDMAKTTGETKIGAWATGAGSRGAAYQKIVKNLKKPYRKIQVGYNLFKEFQRLINEKE